jgi:hypothetical protein
MINHRYMPFIDIVGAQHISITPNLYYVIATTTMLHFSAAPAEGAGEADSLLAG